MFYGDVFLLQGSLSLKDKSPIGDLVVSVEMKRENETAWTKIAESMTDRNGTISVPVTLAGSATFRIRTEGTWERAESISNEKRMNVRNKISLSHPSSIRHGDIIEVQGTLFPRTLGANVLVQKMIAGKWQNTVITGVTDGNGEFVLKASESEKGVVTMRIQVTTGAKVFYSEKFSIVVR